MDGRQAANHRAKKEKNCEYYTREQDIVSEIYHKEYLEALNGAKVCSPCDDCWSGFVYFAKDYMVELGVKKWIFTHYIERKNNA